jgi:subtilisin family serine protease
LRTQGILASMRMPRAEPRRAVLLGMVTVAATATLLATSGRGAGQAAASAPSALSWSGLVAPRPRVSTGGRVIVLLRTPSLAQRVAAAGGAADAGRERAWTSAALAAQKQLISRLAAQGVALHADYSFSRVLDGFSTVAGAGAVVLLERDPAVAGIYPVRIAYPASVSTQVLSQSDFASGVRLAGTDGHGVTVALLDTGVDAAVPYLRGRVLGGIDLVGGDPGALAAADPSNPSELERHGTEMAGLLVGAGGPSGLAGVATGASVLPIRVAGWQPDAAGGWAVYARSDQLIAGLDRAVDPNDDGDAGDAVRVALVPLAEPFAGFPDSPEARAVAGAVALDTLVVAPAGNDGAAGAAYGDVAGPGGAAAALTVGAADTRATTAQVRLEVRSGLSTLFAGTVPLDGAVAPPAPLSLAVAGPRAADFFSAGGTSLVAGRAALVAAGPAPAAAVERAVTAGASAVLLDRALPAGGLGFDESTAIPVVSLPPAVARALRSRLAAGATATVSLVPAVPAANSDAGRVAGFSSTGLAFDGRVKPDLVAPGVALATSDPGADADGSPRFVTVNGSSAAAAVVAGAAALLAEKRPALHAAALAGLLAGTASPLPDDAVTAQGAGLLDLHAAAAAQLAASPATLAFAHGDTSFTLTNLSSRELPVTLAVRRLDHGAAPARFTLVPARAVVRPGASVVLHLRARGEPMEGVVVARVRGGSAIRVPWAIVPASRGALLGAVSLAPTTFAPSDMRPALLTVNAGRVVGTGIRPVARLDVELFRANGDPLGLLARLRDVLPGRIAFGLTGRDPAGRRLAPGAYVVRVVATSVDGSRGTRREVRFVLR